MIEDRFGDPTVRFACLINLLPDGTFTPPRGAAHNLVRIKYFIRSTLFAWSRQERIRRNLSTDSYVSFPLGQSI